MFLPYINLSALIAAIVLACMALNILNINSYYIICQISINFRGLRPPKGPKKPFLTLFIVITIIAIGEIFLIKLLYEEYNMLCNDYEYIHYI